MWRRTANNDMVHLQSFCDNKLQQEQGWRLHKAGEAAVAVPVDESGRVKIQPATSHARLRCFFATDDPNPFSRVIVHSRFPLDPNRKHLDLDNGCIDQHFSHIADAMCQAAQQCEDFGTVLDLLQRTDLSEADTNQPQTRLWLAVRQQIAGLPLACLSGQRALNTLRSCPLREVLPYSWRDGKRFERWEQFKSCIEEHRPGELTGLPFIPCGLETDEREKTLLQLHRSAALSPEELSGLQWAPVENLTKAVQFGNDTTV
jgi:hypothetical protein